MFNKIVVNEEVFGTREAPDDTPFKTIMHIMHNIALGLFPFLISKFWLENLYYSNTHNQSKL